MAPITVFIVVSGNQKQLRVAEDSSVRSLMQASVTQDVLPSNLPLDGFYFVHNGIVLRYDNNETIQTYDVRSGSTLMVCLSVTELTGKSDIPNSDVRVASNKPSRLMIAISRIEALMQHEQLTADEKEAINRQVNAQLAHVTNSMEKMAIGKGLALNYELKIASTQATCMFSFEDDPKESRTQMCCGHVISTDMMILYINNELQRGQTQFYCQYCHLEWKYSAIRHVVSDQLSIAELQALDEKLTENSLVHQAETKRCPRCNSFCQRSDSESASNCVKCPMCVALAITAAAQNGCHDIAVAETAGYFCWCCAEPWCDISSSVSCGNLGCDGERYLQKLNRELALCETRTVNKIPKCPTLRACILCNFPSKHDDDSCSRVQCRRCGTDFCFVCLALGANSRVPCVYGTCPVAPRQILTSYSKQIKPQYLFAWLLCLEAYDLQYVARRFKLVTRFYKLFRALCCDEEFIRESVFKYHNK